MNKRISIVLAIVLALSLLLTACSAPASSADSEGGPAPTPAGDKKVVYWTMWNETEPQGAAIGDAAKAFTAATGITVEVVFNGRDIRKTLQPALDNKEVIDIFDEDVERVNGTWGAYTADLTELAMKDYPTTGGKPYLDVVSKVMSDVAKDVAGGTLKSIPYQPFVFAVFYNKDIFEKAGITASPKTWEEFVKVCETLKASGVDPITVDDAYIPALVGYHMDRLVGKDKTLAMVDAKKFEALAAAQLGTDWANMVSKGYVSKNAAGNVWPAGQQDIASGKVAMYLNGSWLPNEIKDSTGPDFNWGVFAYPGILPAGDGVEANNYGSQCLAINKDSAVKEEAFQFIAYITTGEWDSKIAADSLGVPVGNDSAWPKQTAEAKGVIDGSKTRLPWACGMENDADLTAKIKENFQKLLAGGSAEAFAAAMAS